MGSRKVITFAACVFVLEVCIVQGTAISAEGFASTSISNPSLCSGGQFVIPAIIKPVVQPEQAVSVPEFGYGGFGGICGGFGGYPPALPPIIIEDSGSSSNDLFTYLLLICALRGGSGGCGGGCGGPRTGGGYGFGGYGGGCGGYGLGGYGGYGGGFGNGCGCGCGGCGGCNYPYSNSYGGSSCGCGYNDDVSICQGPSISSSSGSCPNEINLIIRTDSPSTCST